MSKKIEKRDERKKRRCGAERNGQIKRYEASLVWWELWPGVVWFRKSGLMGRLGGGKLGRSRGERKGAGRIQWGRKEQIRM